MPKIILLGDTGTGHGKHGATQMISGSSTVKIDGKPVARQGEWTGASTYLYSTNC
ncbi:hypothetical protein [Providencia stuartii]|uniref:hypothetical protein n=1 Tax=Providencia stuartii TaxID=588 RepID=UPI0015D64C17|nr:hypothetical protein [Providencia stuartii]